MPRDTAFNSGRDSGMESSQDASGTVYYAKKSILDSSNKKEKGSYSFPFS
jgi:hypothetical protein